MKGCLARSLVLLGAVSLPSVALLAYCQTQMEDVEEIAISRAVSPDGTMEALF
jgi:hypothetical protein